MMDANESYYARIAIVQEAESTGYEMRRPSVLFRPYIVRNYDDYVVTYGTITVRAKTPDEAMRLFDKVWTAEVSGNPPPDSMKDYFDEQRKVPT